MADSEDAPAPDGAGRRAQSEIYRAGVTGATPAVPVDPRALAEAARRRMGREAFAYIAGGAGSERTMAANRAAFERWQVWPRPLRHLAERDLSIDLFGVRRPSPLILAPLGVMEMVHDDGDAMIARAADRAGVPYALSAQASRPMEDVAAAAPHGSRNRPVHQ